MKVALVGHKGVAGIADALGAHPLPYALVVQLPGLAYRAPKSLIRAHIMSCSALHELLMNYSQRVMHSSRSRRSATAYTRRCNAWRAGSCSPPSAPRPRASS